MKYKYELQDLSVTHNAIADWLIANPGKGQNARCAAHFGITESWLSTIKQSDAFQALLKSKQEDVFDKVVIPLEEKIAGVAHASVEKLGEMLQETKDGRFVKDVFESSLSKMGYGANAAPPAQAGNTTVNNNTLIVGDRAALAEARELQSKYYGRQLEGPAETSDAQPEATPPRLSLDQEPGMGEARELRPELANEQEEVQGSEEAGGEVRGKGPSIFD